MRRGDLLLTAGWRWHEHHNVADTPMVWLDGLDIPLVSGLDAGFFEFGPDDISDRSTPQSSRSERLVGSSRAAAGVGAAAAKTSPLMAYRWEHTDAALVARSSSSKPRDARACSHPGTLRCGSRTRRTAATRS